MKNLHFSVIERGKICILANFKVAKLLVFNIFSIFALE